MKSAFPEEQAREKQSYFVNALLLIFICNCVTLLSIREIPKLLIHCGLQSVLQSSPHIDFLLLCVLSI